MSADDAPPPTPDLEVPPSPAGYRIWRRCRLYLLTLFLVSSILMLGVSDYILRLREAPVTVVKQVFASLPFPSHIGAVRWTDEHTLELYSVALGSSNPDQPGEGNKVFFRIDKLVLSGSIDGLFNRRLDSLEMDNAQFFLERFDAAQSALPPASPDSRKYLMSTLDWAVKNVIISQGTVFLENIGPARNLNIPIRLGIQQNAPIVLHDVHLNDLDAGEAGQKIQRVEITDVSLVSPFDPLAPVLTLPLTEVTFTYGGLWRRHLREISFIRPTMYLGADLFWFADGFKLPVDSSKPAAPIIPWEVEHIAAHYGALGIAAFGQPPVNFPFGFDASADNVRTDQLDQVTLKTSIPIKRFDHEYPAYKVKIVNLNGRLAFNLPPGDNFIQNAVQTLNVEELSWNGLALNKVLTTVLFNNFGIFGHLEGQCYTGKVAGDFGITYDSGFPWVMQLQATGVDVDPITYRLAPNYLLITGKATGKLSLTGRTIEVLSCDGVLNMAPPGGTMKLGSLQEILAKYPIQGNAVKQAMAQLLVNSLKEYHYQTGGITIKYTPGLGVGSLRLNGPLGKRNFDVFWHPFDKEPGPTKSASEGGR